MDTVMEAKYLSDEWKDIYSHERPPWVFGWVNAVPDLG